MLDLIMLDDVASTNLFGWALKNNVVTLISKELLEE